MRELIINGVPLRDPLKKWSIDYSRSTLLSEISRRYESESLSGFHGTNASPQSFFTSGKKSLVLNLQGSTEDEFIQNLDALQGMLSSNTFNIVSVIGRAPLVPALPGAERYNRAFDTTSGMIREAKGRVLGSIALERINRLAGRLTIILEVTGAFWQSQDRYSSVLNRAVFDLTDLGLTDNSTAPITEALVRVKGPLSSAGSVTISDRGRSDKSLTISPGADFGVDSYLLVDLATMNARRQSSESWDIASGSDARNSLTLVGQGSFTFEPGEPSNSFPSIIHRYWGNLQVIGGLDAEVAISLRRSYLS